MVVLCCGVVRRGELFVVVTVKTERSIMCEKVSHLIDDDDALFQKQVDAQNNKIDDITDIFTDSAEVRRIIQRPYRLNDTVLTEQEDNIVQIHPLVYLQYTISQHYSHKHLLYPLQLHSQKILRLLHYQNYLTKKYFFVVHLMWN